MADIFLSYKRTDRERVAPIMALLESRGWSVWWDTRIDAGEQWDEVIEREIGAANCVVAVWSFESVASRWVRSEASEGLERGILVPTFIDATKPPLEFKLVQSVDLTSWDEDASSPAAQQLVSAVGKLLGPAPTRSAAKPPPLPPEEEHFELPRPLVVGEAERTHWDRIKESSDPRQLQAFLATYPSGHYARAVEARLQLLGVRIHPPSRLAWSAVLGVAAGLLVIVPALLWLSGFLGGPQKGPRPALTETLPARRLAVVETAPPYERALALGESRAKQRLQPDWLGSHAPRAGLSGEERARAERFLALGMRHLEQGNGGAARSFFQRAAEAGLAAGALKMAATYDPAEIERLKATGLTPDRKEAHKWYERARELGAPEAAERLARLSSQ